MKPWFSLFLRKMLQIRRNFLATCTTSGTRGAKLQAESFLAPPNQRLIKPLKNNNRPDTKSATIPSSRLKSSDNESDTTNPFLRSVPKIVHK